MNFSIVSMLHMTPADESETGGYRVSTQYANKKKEK